MHGIPRRAASAQGLRRVRDSIPGHACAPCSALDVHRRPMSFFFFPSFLFVCTFFFEIEKSHLEDEWGMARGRVGRHMGALRQGGRGRARRPAGAPERAAEGPTSSDVTKNYFESTFCGCRTRRGTRRWRGACSPWWTVLSNKGVYATAVKRGQKIELY